MPAEWEMPSAVLLSMPHDGTDWADMLPEVTECYRNIVAALVRHKVPVIIAAPDTESARKALAGIPDSLMTFFTVQTNDTWTRDYGSIAVSENGGIRMLDFKFNGWGLKFAACHDNLVTRHMVESGIITAPTENHLSFVLEGGSIESDGRGTVMTTSHCLLSPNRNGAMSPEEITGYLKKTLGAERVLWLSKGALMGDDTDSHIDTLARLAPHDTIIYTGCDDASDPHYEELNEMEKEIQEFRTADGAHYNLIRLPLPDARYDEDGNRLPATYANYLVLPEVVLMPSYGNELKDRTAAGMLQMVFDKEVECIDCNALIKQHGSLHCATMQIPREALCI